MCLAIMFVSTLLISSQSHISHSVISNLLHLHSYLIIKLLYHCTINTFFIVCILFSFLTVLQHHSHALVGKYNYHIYLTFICIHFSVITQVSFICIPSFNVITLFILHCTLFPELSTRMQYFQCHNPVFITSHLRAITLSHF